MQQVNNKNKKKIKSMIVIYKAEQKNLACKIIQIKILN